VAGHHGGPHGETVSLSGFDRDAWPGSWFMASVHEPVANTKSSAS